MNGTKESFINFLRRTLTNEAISLKLYIIWGFLTLIIFGFLGFLPVSKIFLSNFKLLNELYQNNLNLEKKIEELKIAKERVDVVGEDVSILDNFLPDEFQAQNYLVDMSVLFGQSGYSLDSVSFQNKDSNEVNMSIRASGKGSMKDLVKSLEESRKLNEIQSMTVGIGDRDDSVNMSIKSFIMEKR